VSIRHLFSRRLLPYAFWAARSVAPTTRSVVVHGFPDIEGNATEMVRCLEARYTGSIVWLDSPGNSYAQAVGIGMTGRVRHVSRLSLRGILAYLTSEAVFFTHGVYGVPPSVRRKPTVNLWHGEAIKNFDRLFPDRRAKGRPAEFHVTSTLLLGPQSARASGSPAPAVIATGYPRADQLRRPCSDAALDRLGIDLAKPFVAWVPTFRQTRSVSATATWSDTMDVRQDEGLAEIMARYASRLADLGIQLVIKPHPLDRLSRSLTGAVSLDDRTLKEAGVPFYSLLGRSGGLITDFSSVANEYLLLDRPIAYFFPDREAYLGGRGLSHPDALDNLAGVALETADDIVLFGQDVLHAGRDSGALRQRARSWFGTLTEPRPADRILDAIITSSDCPFSRSISAPNVATSSERVSN
jgi:CDP-glycerol glycerophosphotransferase